MKKLMAILLILTVLLAATPAFAEDSNVVYTGDAGQFVFMPGSEESPTDLFVNFKDVMPGDSLTQTITVRNNASEKVKVEIYIRALGAHEGSEEFLSQLGLRVEKAAENSMEYMFDAYANETAQLTDWVCLGMLYSGGTVNLNVILDVPVEMGNEFQDAIGYLDWEFMVIEYPAQPDDPQPPPTGDNSNVGLYALLMGLCLAVIIVLLILKKRQGGKKDEE